MVKQLESKCKNAKIYFRIMPMLRMCWEHVKILDDKKTLYVRCRQDFGVGKEACEPSYWSFETDGIFYNNTQTELYNAIIPNLLENVLKGQNAIILSFGQTGTGKSLTTIGTENSFEDRGIIPRLISDLYIMKNNSKNKFKIYLKISYIEASKTHIRDLLTEEETVYDMHTMKEISGQKYSDEQQMLKAIFKAEGRKTLVHNSQYMSHAANTVLTITVISKLISDSSLIKTCSKIHVVDLAGADTLGNETSFSKNLFEISTANLAKTQLEQFLLILIENIPEHISATQRLNLLIHYLKDSLNSNSLLRFIGHIRIDKENLLITLSMLRFGQILRGLKLKKLHFSNYEDDETKIKNLEAELKELKMDKDINSMISNKDLSTNITQDRVDHMKGLAENYLRSETDELTVIGVADVNTVLQVFRNLFKKLEIEKEIELENLYKKAFDDAMLSMRLSNRGTGSDYTLRKSKDSLSTARQTRSSRKSMPKRSLSKASTKSLERKKSSSVVLESLNDLTKSKESIPIEKQLKRSKTSSKTLRKSMGSKRKSNGSLSSHRDSIVEDVTLPDAVPTRGEAWKSFVLDETYRCDEIISQMDECERQGKQLNHRYMEEVKKLQDLRNWLDTYKEKLLQARMYRELSGKTEIDGEGQPILSEQETACKEMISNCEAQLVQQQEKVLTIQTELQLCLQLYQEKRRTIDEAFNVFCQSRYNTLVPDTENYTQESEVRMHSMNKFVEAESTEEETKKAKEDEKAGEYHTLFLQYEELKSLMHKQRGKTLHDKLSKKTWVRSCKK